MSAGPQLTFATDFFKPIVGEEQQTNPVNLTRLIPKAVSALRHAHTKQDEFIYILQGYKTPPTNEGRTRLAPGMCAGFKAGSDNGHRLINETTEEVTYLEVGDRTPATRGAIWMTTSRRGS